MKTGFIGRGLLVAVALFTVDGCTSAEQKRLTSAQEMVARNLKDPAAAQFREVRPGTVGFVCGEVNGKNAYGAYVGFKRFIVDSTDMVSLESDSLAFSAAQWTASCDAMLLPSAERRAAYLDSVHTADSLAAIAARKAEQELGLRRLDSQLFVKRMKLIQLRSPNRYERQVAELYEEFVGRWAERDQFPVFADTVSRIVYAQKCAQLEKVLTRTKLLISMDTAKTLGFREATVSECVPPGSMP